MFEGISKVDTYLMIAAVIFLFAYIFYDDRKMRKKNKEIQQKLLDKNKEI